MLRNVLRIKIRFIAILFELFAVKNCFDRYTILLPEARSISVQIWSNTVNYTLLLCFRIFTDLFEK